MQEYNAIRGDKELEDDLDDKIVIVRRRDRGRPKSKTARNQRFQVRMTDKELALLNEMTARYGISRSDLVRKALVVYNHIMGRNR